MIDISMPNFAQSIVPAVVGETNLFCVNCCIISPQMLRLAPLIIMVMVLGILEMMKTSSCNPFKSPNKDISVTPTNKLVKAKMIVKGSKNHNENKKRNKKPYIYNNNYQNIILNLTCLKTYKS